MKHQVILVLCLLILEVTVSGQVQRSLDATISDLRRQIQVRESIDRDSRTPPGLRTANRRVIEQKRAELLETVKTRISQLQNYLTSLGNSATPEEKQYVETSLKALSSLRDALAPRSNQITAAARSSSRPRAVNNQTASNYSSSESRRAVDAAESRQSANATVKLEPVQEGETIIRGSLISSVSEIVVEIRTKEAGTGSAQNAAGSVYSHAMQAKQNTPMSYRVVRFSPPGQTADAWRFTLKLARPLGANEEIRAIPNANMRSATAWESVQELVGQTTELSRPGLQPTALSSEAKGSERRGVVSRSRYVSSDGSTSSTTLRAAAVPARSNSREVSSRAKVSAVPPPVPQVGAAGLSNKRRSAISQLFHRQDHGDQRLVINTPPSGSSEIVIPPALEVTNGTAVTVAGSRSPINKCVVTSNREELKPEPNPLGTFIGIVAKSATGALLATKSGYAPPTFDQLCPQGAAVPVPADAEAQQIDAQLKSIGRSLKGTYESVVSDPNSARSKYEGLAKEIGEFASCKNNACDTEAAFGQAKDNVKKDVTEALDIPLPSLASNDWQMAALKENLNKRYAKQTMSDSQWLDSVNSQLDCYQKTLELIKQTRDILLTARTELKGVSDLLEVIPATDVFVYQKILPTDRNAKVSGKVTCTNFITKQTAAEIPFTVIYQNVPTATVSVGVLFSTLDRRQVTTEAIRTGTAADGTPTFKTVFAETDRASNQLVPFSFFNYYLSGTKRMNLNLTGGVGVNPNNGKTQIEFFVGGSVGFKNVYAHFGEHIGRWQEPAGQFNLGETVPDKFPGLTIERRYSMRPAYGISYKLPVP